MVVSEDETWTCCECDVTDQDYTQDDGLPPGWAVNIDDEPFCAACLKRRPLDPPECRDDDCPNAATLAAAEAEIAALKAACYFEVPEDGPASISGFMCLLCGWDAAPDIPESHRPDCVLYKPALLDPAAGAERTDGALEEIVTICGKADGGSPYCQRLERHDGACWPAVERPGEGVS